MSLLLLFPGTTFTANIAVGTSLSASGSSFVPAVVTPGANPSGPVYQVRVVDMYGTVYGIINVDNSLQCSWALNGPGSIKVGASTFDPSWLPLLRTQASGELLMLDRELQVWRNGVLLWAGKPTRVDLQGPRTTVTGATLEWYLEHLNFGPIERNWLQNPDFEMGSLSGWTTSGPTSSVVTGSPTPVKGTYAAQLHTASTGQDSFLVQSIAVNRAAAVLPVLFTAAGWCYLGSDYSGPALGERGLFIQQNGNPANFAFAKISNSTGAGQWVRLTASISLPAHTNDVINVRLYSPGGTVTWDDISLSIPESVSSTAAGDDIAVLINRIVQYMQDASRGKSPLNMGFAVVNASGGVGSTVGISQVTSWQFDQHGLVSDAVNEYALDDWCDWAVIPSIDGRSRAVTVYQTRRGTFKPIAPLIVDGNISDLRWSYDGEQAASAVRVLGAGGGGSDQEVGVYVDTAMTGGTTVPDLHTTAGSTAVTSASNAFQPWFSFPAQLGIYASSLPLSCQVLSVADAGHATLTLPALVTATVRASVGGLVIDAVQSAPMEVPVGGLAARATTESKRLRGPVLAATVTARDRSDLIGVVWPGDTIPVIVRYGWVQVATTLRISSMTLDAKTETLQINLMAPGPSN